MGEVANTEYSRLLRNVSYFTLSLIVPEPTATSAPASRVPAASSASPSGVMRGRSPMNSRTLPSGCNARRTRSPSTARVRSSHTTTRDRPGWARPTSSASRPSSESAITMFSTGTVRRSPVLGSCQRPSTSSPMTPEKLPLGFMVGASGVGC